MYIRTKNGIYEIDEIKPYFLDEKQKLFMNNTMKIAVNENLVISQADTIEELCDEFVLVDETLPPHIDRDFKEIKMYKTYIAGSRGNIYGAIWTDKGLIYVAKMNDKGELELI